MAKITKAEAVRQTIAAGITKPRSGAEHVKKAFGLVVSPSMFSSYKSAATRKTRGAISSNAGGVSWKALIDVKKVMDRYGAEKVKAMVDILT